MSRVGVGSGSKLGAELVGRALQFGLIYLAQRTLGPVAYGHFTYAVALGFVLVPVTDLGVQLTLTQQISRDRDRAAATVGTALALKLGLALVASLLLLGLSQARPPEVRAATLGLGLAMIVASFAEFFGYVFRGLQRVEIDAATMLVTRVVTVGCGVWALVNGFGLVGLAVAYLAGGTTGAAVGYLWVHRFLTPHVAAWREHWKPLVSRALPLGMAIVLSIAYTRTAVFLLDALRGPADVGAYGVAQKLTEPLAIIPAALMAAVFPAFVEARAGGGAVATFLRTRTVALLAVVGTLLATAGFIGGPWLLGLLYGEQYAASVLPFRLLSLAVLLTFVNYALTHFVIAHDLHARYLRFTATVFVVNLGLCFVLIPSFGMAGAAGAVIVTEIVLFALCWRAISGADSLDSTAGAVGLSHQP